MHSDLSTAELLRIDLRVKTPAQHGSYFARHSCTSTSTGSALICLEIRDRASSFLWYINDEQAVCLAALGLSGLLQFSARRNLNPSTDTEILYGYRLS